MRIQITIDIDIDNGKLEDNQAHLIVEVTEELGEGEYVRGGDWFQDIDVNVDEPLAKLISELYEASWELKDTDSDIVNAINAHLTR